MTSYSISNLQMKIRMVTTSFLLCINFPCRLLFLSIFGPPFRNGTNYALYFGLHHLTFWQSFALRNVNIDSSHCLYTFFMLLICTEQKKLRIMIYKLFDLQQITIYFILTIWYGSLISKQTIFIGFIKNQWSVNEHQD
jgi:hypothetical protein